MNAAMSQRMSALDRAREVTRGLSEAKRDLRAGALSISAAFEDDRAQAMTVEALLLTQRLWGQKRVTWLLEYELLISPWRRVRELTDRQKTLLLDALGVVDAA